MKRFLLSLLIFALVVAALFYALRPVAIGQYRQWQGAKAIQAYRSAAAELSTLDRGMLMSEARAYNEAMDAIALRDPFEARASVPGDGAEMLELTGDGVIAVLSVPKLGAEMPIYREDAPAEAQSGVRHMALTSLPVSGEGGCCVIYGPRDGRFADLDRLIAGDCFYIETIQDTLIYEVEQVLTPRQEELAAQDRDGEDDFCTLMTQASRDDDPRRMLVRARRVSRREAPLADDTQLLPDWAARGILAVPVLLVGLILLGTVEALRRCAGRRRVRKTRL